MTKRLVVTVPTPRFCPECGEDAVAVHETFVGHDEVDAVTVEAAGRTANIGSDSIMYAVCAQDHMWPITGYQSS